MRRGSYKEGDLKPHLIRYWLTPVQDEQIDQKVEEINNLYQQAPELAKAGECVVSTDELTGVQALERKHPGLPMQPGCQPENKKSANQDSKMSPEPDTKCPLGSFGNDLRLRIDVQSLCSYGG
jgi:hypothetical protein